MGNNLNLVDDMAEAMLTGAIIRHSHLAIKSEHDVKEKYFAVPERWKWIKAAQEVARKMDGNEGRDIEFEELKVTCRATDEELARLEECYRTGYDCLYSHYLRIAQEAAIARELHKAFTSWSDEVDVRRVTLGSLRKDIDDIQKLMNAEDGHQSTNESLLDWNKVLEDRYESRHEPGLLRTGLPSIDGALGKVQGGEMIIISANRKAGKSSFVSQIIEESCEKLKTPTLVVSLEMTKTEMIDRLVAHKARVNSKRIKSGDLREYDFPRIGNATAQISNMPIYFADQDEQTIGGIENMVYYFNHRFGVKIVVIDYVQLVESSLQNSNRVEQLVEISLRLRKMAKRLGIVLVCCSQTNSLGITAGSTQFEKDCTKLIKISAKGDDKSIRDIDLELNRSGETKNITAQVDWSTSRFEEINDNPETIVKTPYNDN